MKGFRLPVSRLPVSRLSGFRRPVSQLLVSLGLIGVFWGGLSPALSISGLAQAAPWPQFGSGASPLVSLAASPIGLMAQTPTASPPAAKPAAQPSPPPGIPASAARLPWLAGKATVVMMVKGKPITIELDGTNAPITAGNFVDLVQKGVYNGVVFHRVVTQPQPFVAQGGDPQSKDPKIPSSRFGTGGFIDPQTQRERNIPLEIKPSGASLPVYGKTLKGQSPVLRHRRGAIAMARTQAPNSASSQFYFALSALDFLDGSYAVFGYVTEGMDVVNRIQQGDRIDSAKVTKGAENLQIPAQ